MKRFTPFHALLGLSAVLLFAGLVYSVRSAWVDYGSDPRQAEAASRAVADAERSSGQVQRDFQQRSFEKADAQAREALTDARALFAACESRAAAGADRAALEPDLVRAAVGFGRWLDLHPADVDVLLLRARAWEQLRFADKALLDLRRAVELKPDLAEPLADRLKQAQAGYPKAK